MSSPTISDSDVIDAPRVAQAMLADPASVILGRARLEAIATVALRDEPAATRAELALLLDCARDLSSLRMAPKRVIITLSQTGVVDDVTMQRVIDRFELWSD